MSGMYSDLLNVLRAKANRKAPNNVIWSECLRVIEDLMAENERLRSEMEVLKKL